MTYIAPKFYKDGFTCPHCGVYSNQDWNSLERHKNHRITNVYISFCQCCKKDSIWVNLGETKTMVYPKKSSVPLPNEDLNQEIKDDYIEASNVLNDSPRAACALLRLALQKLMIQVGEKGENLNDDIKNLVANGLNKTIQQALDSIRINGNGAVHPGELNLKDDIQTATKMFSYINIIADILITKPKEINETFNLLPEGKRKGVEERDKPKNDNI